MSEENKPKSEFPSFVGHESTPQPRVETNEPIENGVIVEQPITPEERIAMEDELQHAATPEQPLSPVSTPQELGAPVAQPANLETLGDSSFDNHVETKLKEDNPFDNVTEAHDAVNALMRGETKP